MEITVTLNLVDPAVTESQLSRLLNAVRDLRAAVATPASSTAPVAPYRPSRELPSAVSRLGSNAAQAYETLLQICDEQGDATLDDAAIRLGKSVATVRAYMMNAGRTLAEADNPLIAAWDTSRKCVVYTKK